MQNVSKRTILWIVPILILVIFWFLYGPKDEITDHEYIDYIKQSTLNDSSQNIQTALESICSENKWVYFQTSKRQHVVEFQGSCAIESKNSSQMNLQFIVEKERKDFQVGAMLLDGEQQSETVRDEFLSEILAGQNEVATPKTES